MTYMVIFLAGNLISIFEEVIDRESPTTGVWVLDWVIYNSIINEVSSIAR